MSTTNPKKSNTARITAAKKAQAVAKQRYVKAKKRVVTSTKDARRAEVNLVNKRLAVYKLTG